MPVRARALNRCDINRSIALLKKRPHFENEYGQLPLARWAEVSERLVRRGAANGAVVEDVARDGETHILTTGFSVFVNHAWLRAYMADPFPFAGFHILNRLADGEEGLILSEEEIRRGNTEGEGLRAVILMMAWDPDMLSRPDAFEIKMAAMRSFALAHSGYRLAELVHEVLPGFEKDFFLEGRAWVERSRYPKHYSGRAGKAAGPILVGLTREEAQRDGSLTGAVAPLFVWRDFRFCFSRSQQRVLELVSRRLQDREIAIELGVGESAVGRRLQRIYRRVESCQDLRDPVFAPATTSAAKRELLIDYLHKHPHELRPHSLRARRLE